MSDLYNIRIGKAADHNLVKATFLRGLYYGDSWFSSTDKDSFMANYEKVVSHLLGSPNALLSVACLPDDPDVILGYSLTSLDQTTIHWVFVKKNWRKMGIAKSLCPDAPTTVTHLTKLGKALLPKLTAVTFNPFQIT